jgi:hypothetical protein
MKIMNKMPFFLCLCFFALTVEAFAQTKLTSKVGTVNPIKDSFVCLAIPNSKLMPGMKIQVVVPDKPQLVRTGVIDTKEQKSCSSDIDVAPRLSFYRVRMPGDRDIDYGIGVTGAKRIRVVNGLARADINGDGKLEYFRECSSFEGFHFTIWTGKPLKGKRIWHSYYYLGYDTVFTCKKKDYKP